MTQPLETLQNKRLSRRGLLYGLGGLGASLGLGGSLSGCPAMPNLDVAILNFALNLEYLEAEYYLRATGQSLTAVGDNPGTVTGGREVDFDRSYWRMYAEEIAEHERQHVSYLRSALGDDAVDRPAIDFTNAFRAVGQAAGLGDDFDPFSSEFNFLLGAFLFEDVGVTAYKGGVPLLSNPGYVEAAAGILAVEAYHAAMIRTTIWNTGDPQVVIDIGLIKDYQSGLAKDHTTEADAISDARDSLDGSSDLDQPIASGGESNIVPSDASGIAFSRSVAQVHNIAYLTAESGVTAGGFFPNGTNNPNPAFTTT
ncbi:MAG: ferritin-like domain-containing protein [Candidatus Hydrogenedens sp.]|nr:ferritin-like domain-containing protein [Candidatus Hydrogenedens sp.]